MSALLEIANFSLEFRTRSGIVRALDNINLELQDGAALGLVGESGSGKSVLSFAVLGIQDAAATVTGGHIRFAGHDLLANRGSALQALRSADVQVDAAIAFSVSEQERQKLTTLTTLLGDQLPPVVVQ